MRILLATNEYVTEPNFDGGLANYTHRIALSLIQLGHEPIVVVASDRNEMLRHKGIDVHRVKIKARLFFKAINYCTARHFNMSLYLIALGRDINRKIRQIHESSPISIIQYSHLGGVSLFKSIDVLGVIRLSSYTPLARAMGGYEYAKPFQTRQQEYFEQLALKRADAIFGPSVMISKIVEREIGRSVEVIESPFFMDNVERDEEIYQRLLSGKQYLLFFGTLSILKGVHTLGDISHELLSQYPDLQFVFIGKEQGTYQGYSLMDYVRNQAKEHQDRILYLGQLRHEKLYPILYHARAVVLPSRVDNFPNACLEAMAHRKIVIGTRGTSFEQLIDDGKSGFLANIDDPLDLLAAIKRALDLGKEEMVQIENKAVERIDRLKPSLTVKQLVDFYSKIINKRGL